MSNVTGLKEGRIRLEEFGLGLDDATSDLIDAAGLSKEQFITWGKDIAKGGETGADAFQNVANAIMSVEDETIKNSLAAAIMGTMYEDTGDAIFDALLGANDETINLTNATEKLSDKVEEIDASPTVELKDALNKMMDALSPLLIKIAELVTKFANWASENPKVAASFAGITAAVGIVGGAVTSLVGAFSTLQPVLGPLVSKILPRLTLLLGSLAGPAGLAVAAIAGFAIWGGTKLVKELSKSSIEVSNWADDVSEGTAKAVGGFLDMNEEVTNQVNLLSWSGQKVTQEMADGIVGTFNTMGDQVLAAMQKDHEEQLKSMQNFFADSAALTDEEEAAIIEKMIANNEKEAATVQEGKDRVAEILATAKNNNRGLTEQEQQEINAIQETMKNNGIQYLSESERDQKVILERLKNDSSEITAAQAAQVVQNSLAQKDETVKNANEQYNQTVAEIIKQRDETGVISAEQADKLIADAKKQRDETVANAESMHSNVVSEAQAQATEHVNEVDWETGEVLSKWEVFKGKFSTKVDEIRTTASKKFGEVSDIIDEKMEDAKGFAEDAIDAIKDFFTNIELPSIEIPPLTLPDLPKLSISGEFSWKNKTVPKVSWVWNAAGGILDTATLIGAGEAGKEAIIPLSEQALKPFAKAIVASMPSYSSMASDEITNNFNIDQIVIREEADIQKLASQIAKEQMRLQRAGGKVYYD